MPKVTWVGVWIFIAAQVIVVQSWVHHRGMFWLTWRMRSIFISNLPIQPATVNNLWY